MSPPQNARLAPGAFPFFILKHMLALLAIMAAGRLIMVLAFAEPEILAARPEEFRAMWRRGFLFDLRTAAIGLAPLYALGLAACCSGPAARLCGAVRKVYVPVLFFLVTLAAVTSFYYYRTFHTEIDIFIFSLINDDTRAILSILVHDYPLALVLPLLAAGTFLGAHISRRAWRAGLGRPPSGRSPALAAAALLAFTALYVLAARGSVGVFPLRRADMMVGATPLLNKAVPNGLMALKWAYDSYRRSAAYRPVPGKRGRELALAALGRENLGGRTAKNPWLAENPPHVVLVVMESFGSNLLEFDRAGSADLLGSFRRHLEEDFLFRRFLPEDNGTLPSLAALLFSCPDQTITISQAKSKRLGDTPFDVFKAQGYETAFIHAGSGYWNNLGPYLAAQGVDLICDQNYLTTLFQPEKPRLAAEAGLWGLPDEYAFKLARRLLEQSSKPMFIVILTLSNHPPYAHPPGYSPVPIRPEAELAARLEVKEADKPNMLYAFQYAASSLGDFIAGVKESPLGGRTVIAATGDHQMRSLKAKYPDDLLLDTAVPFYLYAPESLLAHIPHRYAPERPGSHKDIPPTLYALSLSEAPYYSVGGRNLLAERDEPDLAFGYNVRLFIDAEGVCAVDEALAGRRYAYGPGLAAGEDLGPVPPALAEKIRAFGQLRRWQINARVAGEE